MRKASIRGWIVCAGVAAAGVAWAEPRADVREQYKRAVQLEESGEDEQALALIERGLAIAPAELKLLQLKGALLINLRDYTGALAAYQAYLDAGAKGANRRGAGR